MPKKKLVILSADPGVRNYSITVTANGTPIFGTRLQNTIDNIRNSDEGLVPQTLFFLEEYVGLIRKFKPNDVIMERFQARGFRGASGEYITTMNAFVSMLCCFSFRKKKNPILVTAVQWKSRLKKSLPFGYEFAKKLRLQPHDLDSMLIGLVISGQFVDSKVWMKKKIRELYDVHQFKLPPKNAKLSKRKR